MEFLLRLKSWQLFAIIILPLMVSSFWLDQLLYGIGYVVYIGWMYSIGIKMHSLFSFQSKPKVIYFKISCLSALLIVIITTFFDPLQNGPSFAFWIESVVIVCSMFYILNFAARMLESVIQGKIIGFSDSLKAFFGFWFFPFGIWYIQPVVKIVLEKHETL